MNWDRWVRFVFKRNGKTNIQEVERLIEIAEEAKRFRECVVERNEVLKKMIEEIVSAESTVPTP